MARTGMFDDTMESKVPMAVDEDRIQESIDWGSDYKIKIRQLVNGMYDTQKLRIATGNRIVAQINQQMGIIMDKPMTDEEQDKQKNKVISELRKEYKRITDAYVSGSYSFTVKEDKHDVDKTITFKEHSSVRKIIEEAALADPSLQYIKDKMTYDLVSTYVDLLAVEEKQEKLIAGEVKNHPMWDKFFSKVTGCGPAMAAVCLAYLDIHKARHCSNFISYCGIDVVPVMKEETEYDDKGNEVKVMKPVMEPVLDEEGKPTYDAEGNQVFTQVYEGRSKRHTEMVEYTDRNGNVSMKKSLTYQPFLKTKMCGVLGPNLVKCGKRGGELSYYAEIFYDYKNRLQNNPKYKDYTKGHINNMANRYIVKCFLKDLWAVWREDAGYVVTEPYEVAYLHKAPHKYNEFRHQIALRTAARAAEREAERNAVTE